MGGREGRIVVGGVHGLRGEGGPGLRGGAGCCR
jgi:hypothetical protein